ncbi:MAG: YdcF family protein [Solobacterium sp.]|nr:YdcF family protein [Solobacterium sp.]
MLDTAAENIMVIGPVFAVCWALMIVSAIYRPQRYSNSILLMFTLAVTVVFIAGFLGDYAGVFLLVCFALAMLVLLLVPVLLILNGIQMIKRESLSLAHVLSLCLGVFVGTGEIGAFVYVLAMNGSYGTGKLDYWVLLLVFTVFYFSLLVLCFVLYSVFMQIMPHRMNFNYVIIHGCGLLGGERMTKLLSSRVDKAVEIYGKCRKKPMLIPSGGQGPDEKISEAEAMRRYLLEKGIPEEKILVEDRSATTRENILNSKEIIGSREGPKKTALISSNYHVYRCLRIARDLGFRCTGIGADVALYYWPSALIREFIAVFVNRSFLIRAMIGYVIFISPVLYGLLV